MYHKKLFDMPKFKVNVRVQRDFERTVIAKTMSQAIAAAKKDIADRGIKIRKKDFDKQSDNAWEY
jgi:hypothetical protein